MKKKQPNFLLIGAPKAGTTSVANYLAEHPDIFISNEKEPFYFASDAIGKVSKEDPMFDAIMKRAHLNKKSYYKLFESANEKLRGEATVHYLYHYDEVIPKVINELGDIKIIILLRNPIERAFSNFNYQHQGQYCSFEKALELESQRKEKGYNSFWFYKEVGKYFTPVKVYLQEFSEVHVCFFEDLVSNPVLFMQDIYKFLETDNKFIPDIKKQYNQTFIPKSKLIHFLYYYRHKFNLKLKTPIFIKEKAFKTKKNLMNDTTKIYLKKYFKEDIKKLENLINKDLSHWYA